MPIIIEMRMIESRVENVITMRLSSSGLGLPLSVVYCWWYCASGGRSAEVPSVTVGRADGTSSSDW